MQSLHILHPAEIEALWPPLWEVLSRADEYDPAVAIDEIGTAAAIRRGEVTCFYVLKNGAIAGVFTVHVYATPRGLTAEVTALAGESLSEWLSFLDVVENWAKDRGCKRILAGGRKGWERVLKEKGYSAVAVVVEKALTGAGR